MEQAKKDNYRLRVQPDDPETDFQAADTYLVLTTAVGIPAAEDVIPGAGQIGRAHV